MENEIGGRLFFTNLRRSLVDEDEINLVSVGIDIGSSTTHLAFSSITLERVDARYVVSARLVLFESEILLTPYTGNNTIDTQTLEAFFKEQYRLADIKFEEIDTGALILTGTAVRRKNARAIAEIFSEAAGKFVSVSAGDEMEAVLAAYGSGAVSKSRSVAGGVLHVDIGGGTTKIARCIAGEVNTLTAIDVGARLLALDDAGKLARIEPAGERFAKNCGVTLALGQPLSAADMDKIAGRMADHLLEAMGAAPISDATRALLRLDALGEHAAPAMVTFSGGVSEYIYGRETRSYGDLGPSLARQIAERVRAWGPAIEPTLQGIRATVIGASQYTVQVSGSTIFVSQMDILPLRNIPTIKPRLELAAEAPDPAAIAEALRASAARLGAVGQQTGVALCYSWSHSATFGRIDAFCRGVLGGFAAQIEKGQPLVLISDSDIGGLIGLHFAEELKVTVPIVSIDGISLQEFDFVDIGAMLEGSGSVPVVVKSLIFPISDAVGQKQDD